MGIFSGLFYKANNKQLTDAVNNGAFLVDVRTAAEVSAGGVTGAINIPLDKIHDQLAKFKGKKNIVVFCLSGGRSASAKRILEQNGVQNVINGGSWKNIQQIVNK